MATTIQISNQLQETLSKRKLFSKETYEEVIWDLLEDTLEVSEETKLEIQKARLELKNNESLTLEEVKRELEL